MIPNPSFIGLIVVRTSVLLILAGVIAATVGYRASAQTDAAGRLRGTLSADAAETQPARQLVVDVRDVMSVVLEEGDVIRISVLNDPIMSMDEALINKGGAILHDVLKELKVAGKTLKEAQEMIYEILVADYLVDPTVTLTIVKYASYEFSVLDEVIRPGTYSLPRDKKVDIAQAIAMAGGPTRVGSSKVVIERLEGAERRMLKVDISKPNNVIVQPEDKIKVGEKFW
jgi:protein involved in polysaccharide export with SLBB domain